jgi:hypothetical protein
VKGRALREWLPGELKDNPDLTLAEHRKAFEEEGGMEVSDATMSRAIELGFLVSGRSKKVEGYPSGHQLYLACRLVQALKCLREIG